MHPFVNCNPFILTLLIAALDKQKILSCSPKLSLKMTSHVKKRISLRFSGLEMALGGNLKWLS